MMGYTFMEPEITINGQKITNAMAMTIRVAIESFAQSINSEGLGHDEHGLEMVRLYNERIHEIRSLMHNVKLTGRGSGS